MYKQTEKNMTFSTYAIEKRLSGRSRFYEQIDLLIDWKPIAKVIQRYYQPGKSATGGAAYPGLLLFKICLIGTWNGLSDRATEEAVAVNLLAMRFCGLNIEDEIPDHSTISRFRTALSKKNAFEKLLEAINAQLQEQALLVKTGMSIDASLTEAPRRPRTKPTYEIASDREEDKRPLDETAKEQMAAGVIEVTQPGVDNEARWLKKGGKSTYGYKQHTAVEKNGLIIALSTTAANVHDSQPLEEVLSKAGLEADARIYADKAYRSQEKSEWLKRHHLKNGMQYRAVKNKPLNKRQKQFNRLVTQTRYKVERTFGSVKKWFGAGIARYVGLAKMHTQHLLEAIAYNLKRLPRLWAEKQVEKMKRTPQLTG